MNSREKRRMWVLAVASGLATVGLIGLAVAASGRAPSWTLAAASSPLALRCLGIIGGGVLVLGLLAALLIRMRPRPSSSPRALHGDQGGTAAVELAFVFPLALMIFLLVTQAALLFNANMVVHYASYAAARMAVVVVPMDINEENHNLVWPCDENTQGPSTKIEMIRRAAVLALVPISAQLRSSSNGGIGPVVPSSGGKAVYDQTRSVFNAAGGKDQMWFGRVKAQYAYADNYTKIELAPPDHWQDGNPDPDCPYRHQRRDAWTQWGWSYIPYCPYYHRPEPIWDFWYWEDLDCRITYQFLLEVPYACVFLGDAISVPGRTGQQYAAKIQWVGILPNEGGPELKTKDAGG